MSGVFRRLSKKTQRFLRTWFFRLGYQVAGHPWKTIACALLLVGLCMVGFINFQQESREEKLWVPQGTIALENKAWVEERYASGLRPERIIVTSREGEEGDVATQQSLLDLIKILRVSSATTVDFKGTTYTFQDLCQNASDSTATYCTVTSVLDLFYDSDFITSPPNFLIQLKPRSQL